MFREVKRLKEMVANAISTDDRDRHGGYSSSSSTDAHPPQRGLCAGPIGARNDDVRSDAVAVIPTASNPPITVAKMMMVIDSIERAKNAAQSLQRMAHNSAKTFQERANAAMETSTQMADEIQVLAAGKQCMSEFVSLCQQRNVV